MKIVQWCAARDSLAITGCGHMVTALSKIWLINQAIAKTMTDISLSFGLKILESYLDSDAQNP